MQVNHQECPFCEHKDCFSYNTELDFYNCFSCGKKGKYSMLDDTPTMGNDSVMDTPTMGNDPEIYVPDTYRGISKSVMERCGVFFTKYQGKEQVVYTYPNATKYRTLPKDIVSKGKLDKFWGHDDYTSGEYVTLTEGEEDRMSVIEIMGEYPCMSFPNSTPSKEFWNNAKVKLGSFKKIILSVDNDDAGNKLAEKTYRLFPGKVFRVPHSRFKDANEFLQNDAQVEYRQAWWNAQKMKPADILSSAEDFLKLFNDTPNYDYCPTGIPDLDYKILGLHKGLFTVIVSPTGIGKTEFMRYLEYQVLTHENEYSLATCHLEETPLRSLLGLVSYHLREDVTRKDVVAEKGLEDMVKDAISDLSKGERLYQFSIRPDDTVEDVIDKVRFLATAMEVDYIFIEPIQDIVMGDVSNKESLLSDLSNALSRLAPELNVGIIVIAHANEEGDTKYCKTIAQKAAFEINLYRDMDADTEEERNTMTVKVGRKNRVGNGSGFAGQMFFDRDSYMLEPVNEPVIDTDGVKF